ncbi:MAG: ATP-binding cassette domain-containing protein [Planctomycetota bacterium]
MADLSAKSPYADVKASKLLKRIWSFVRPDAGDIWAVTGFAIAVGVLALAVPVAAQVLFNYISFGISTQPVVVLGVTLAVALAISAILRIMMYIVVEIVQRRVFVRVLRDLGDKLPRTTSDAFGRVGGAEFVNRFFDVLTVQKVGSVLLLDGIAAFLQTVIGLVILWFYHPLLLGFSLLLLALSAFILVVMARGAVPSAVAESSAKYDAVASLEEIVQQRGTYRHDGGPSLARSKSDAFARKYVDARRSHFRVVIRQLTGAFSLQVVAASSLLVLGGYLVIGQQLSLGQLVASELIVTTALGSFLKIAGKMKDIYDLLAGVHKLSSLSDLPRERESGDELTHRGDAASLAVRDITFAYAGSRPLFSGLRLEVAAGERLGVVGATGSGKSTLADLVSAGRSPSAGRIELDGVDLRELSIESVREHAVVLSRPELVAGTIQDNVLLGRPGLTADDCRSAMTAVGLLERVRALPDGLATRVARDAAPLSHGELHQLMIARAIAGGSRLLIAKGVFDEVDPRVRETIARALRQSGCTVIAMVRDASHLPRGLVSRVVAIDPTTGSMVDVSGAGFGNDDMEALG